MPTVLVKVSRSNHESRSFALEDTDKLNATRATLSQPPHNFMQPEDAFLHDGSTLDRSAEVLIPLSSLMGDGKTIHIGASGGLSAADGVDRYNRMSEGDKRALFENLHTRRGLTVDAHGFKVSFQNVYEWRDGGLPRARTPSPLTQLSHSYTFTEETHTFETSGVHSGSVSLTTPFGGGEANFRVAQSRNTSSKHVTQYMTERYLSNKVDLDVSARQLRVAEPFLAAVRAAAHGRRGNINGYQDLVKVLNEWGWYVPLRYTLGGALYATKRTEISEYSEAESKSRTFGGSFQAAFKGIGGGAAYENSTTTTTTTTTSQEAGNTVILQMGGKAGTNNDYKAWNDSLDKAITWATISYQALTPSLMLLVGADNDLLTTCNSLLQQFNSYAQVKDLQKYIDVAGYQRELGRLLNPFGE
jgi:hypothetical protein